MRPIVVLALAVSAFSTACGPPLPPGGGGGGAYYAGGPLPSAQTVTYRIQPGVGVNLVPGVDVGYFVTTGGGGSYRLFWTGDARNGGGFRRFYGSVWTPGAFTRWSAGCEGYCPLESDDYLGRPAAVPGGQRLDFDGITTAGLDGFDFTVDTEPVYFDLVIDGAADGRWVLFPATDNRGQLSNTDTVPFALVSN